MRKNNISVVYPLVFFILFHHPIAHSAQQVRCTGKVLDTQGQPIAGAKVAAYEMQFDGIAGNFALHKAGETKTADDGSFTFTTDPKPEKSLFHQCYIVAAKQNLSLGWTVWKMREDVEVNIKLGRPERLEGTIVDEAGKPVAGAQVRANLSGTIETTEGEEKNWLPGIPPLEELGAQTDNQGRFSFNNIPADLGVDLLVTAPGRAITYTYQLEISEPAFKSGQTNIKVVLPAEARIEGKILDPDTGKGVAGTKFAVVGSSLFYYRFVHTTNDDGSFSVGGLQTGQYLLRNGGFPHTDVDTESGKTANITVQADRLSRPRGITGIVRDQDGQPFSGAVVSTCPPITEETLTDAKGAFALKSARSRIPGEGAIYLLVRDEERNLAAADELDDSAKEFEITLDQGAVLSGKVIDVNGNGIPSAELSLTFRMTSVGYVICDDMEIDNSGNYEIRAVPPGYTYSVHASANGYGRRLSQINVGGTTSERIEIEPLVLSAAYLSASGIVMDEFDQPVPDVRILVSGDGQPSRQTLSDAKGQFTIENICSGRISIYADKSEPQRLRGRGEAEAGKTDIRIVVAQLDERGRAIPKQPPSLVGKTLPDWKTLKVNLPQTAIQDKKVLVCFFDMQQRPSRNCLLQLNKRAQELQEKEVVVVAVQASKVDGNTLSEWIKNQNISFPVGMIEAEEKETRLAWGVQSLPWLILTDAEYVVIAEGFSLNELNEVIR